MDLEDYSNGMYEKLLQYAIWGFEKLHYTTINSVKVAYLTMSDLNTVQLPNDYVQYYKIGIPIGGKLWNLGLNNDILLPRDLECGDDARELFAGNQGFSSFSGGFFYTSHMNNGEWVGGLYGVGGGFRQAHYRIDEERNQIVFDSVVPNSEIVLEYKASGISSQTLVPRVVSATVIAYIHWRRLTGKNRLAESREMERIWKEEMSELRSFKLRFNAKEYLDMLHEERILTPKR